MEQAANPRQHPPGAKRDLSHGSIFSPVTALAGGRRSGPCRRLAAVARAAARRRVARRRASWRSSRPEGCPVRWRTPVGPGFSGPAVAGGRVFLMDRVLDENAPADVKTQWNYRDKTSGRERVLCLDERDRQGPLDARLSVRVFARLRLRAAGHAHRRRATGFIRSARWATSAASTRHRPRRVAEEPRPRLSCRGAALRLRLPAAGRRRPADPAGRRAGPGRGRLGPAHAAGSCGSRATPPSRATAPRCCGPWAASGRSSSGMPTPWSAWSRSPASCSGRSPIRWWPAWPSPRRPSRATGWRCPASTKAR